DGLNLTCGDQSKYNVEQHQGGSVGWLTGAIQQGALNYPANCPSIDQVLAGSLSKGKAFGSLQLAVRWATGKSHGKPPALNAMFFQASARSEEHTSELQSRRDLVCRLLLEKKKKKSF